MPQRDYILRIIEQAAAVLRALRQMILGQQASPGEVEKQLRRAVQQLGFDLDVARISDAESLERAVAPTGELEPARGWLVAEVMYLDGLEAEIDGRPDDAMRSYRKALRLFRLFDPRSPIPSGFPEAHERIEEIQVRLTGLGYGDIV